MKLYRIFLLFSLAVSMTSCDDFLDVRPKSEKLEADLFENAKGFEEAINGVYGTMKQDYMYGRYLYWGTTEVMCQNLYCTGNSLLQPLSQFNYTNENVKGMFSGIWTSTYQTIGYANNVLSNLENESESSLPLYKYYKGEMLAVRAMLHFDMLRIFAPTTETATGIPYVTKYSYAVTPFYKVGEDYDKIIADLTEAETLLAGDAEVVKYPHVNDNYYTFLTYRETHMNLYAVQALLARVYWMRGNMPKAGEYAQKVIESGKFPLVDRTEIKDYLAGTLSPKETIFGIYSTDYISTSQSYLYNNQSFVSYNPYSEESGGNHIRTFRTIYATDNDNSSADFRLNHFVAKGSMPRFLKLVDYYTIDNNARTGLISGVTLLHTSEMYLIAAEALLETNYTQAVKYFDEELSSRGLNGFSNRGLTLTKDNIYNEYCKEMYGEGQTWFNMKRLNKDIVSNAENRVIPAHNNIYVVPIPDEEYEYRQ